MQGLVIVGQHFEDAAADPLDLVQPALPKKIDRSRKHARDLGQRSRTGSGHDERANSE
jgi:hypothetical protein